MCKRKRFFLWKNAPTFNCSWTQNGWSSNLVLMSVSLKELKGYITLSTADSIKAISDNILINWTPFLKAEDIEIGWEGYNPYSYKVNNASSDTGKLVLLHGYGYCAGKNHFTSEHFSDFFVLDRFGKNMLHDEYAKEVINDLDQEGITIFSAYSHSQGGQ